MLAAGECFMCVGDWDHVAVLILNFSLINAVLSEVYLGLVKEEDCQERLSYIVPWDFTSKIDNVEHVA